MKIFKTYRLKEGSLKLELEKDFRGKIVLPMYIEFRPEVKANLILYVNESDFDEDMKTLVPDSIGSDFFLSCIEQLRKLVDAHVKRFGRILPADLEMYCTESLVVIIALGKVLHSPLNPDAEKIAFQSILTKFSNEQNIPIEIQFRYSNTFEF